MTDIDVGNYQLVGVQGSTISVSAPRESMTKYAALVHAAWLVTLADPLGRKFPAILKAVQET